MQPEPWVAFLAARIFRLASRCLSPAQRVHGIKAVALVVNEAEVARINRDHNGVSGGGSMPVHYLPSDPSVCQVGDTLETKWSGLLTGLGAWVVAAFLAFAKPDDHGSATVRPAMTRSQTRTPVAGSSKRLRSGSSSPGERAGR